MWVKFRHTVIFAVLRFIFKIFLFLKYGYTFSKFKCGIKKPYLILSNHVTALDPAMVALSFNAPVYFVASDDLFSIKNISPLLKYLVAPIPKSKSSSDLSTVKDSYKVIKEGGSVCVFPEGNRTYNGVTLPIPFSVVKFVRLLKAPLLLYKIEGGYGVQPRWGGNIRRGRMYGRVQRVLTYDEYKNMSDDGLFKFITDNLYSNAFYGNKKFKSRKKAEYIERFLYACPDCGSFCTLYSGKDTVNCKKCGLKVKYNEDLSLSAVKGSCGFLNAYEWDMFQKDKIRAMDFEKIGEKEPVFSDGNILFRENIRCKKKIILGAGTMRIYKDRLEIRVIGKGAKETETKIFNYGLKDISSAAVFGKNRLCFYCGGKIFQIIGDRRFNALKYVNLYYHMKNKNEGVTDEFLGL